MYGRCQVTLQCYIVGSTENSADTICIPAHFSYFSLLPLSRKEGLCRPPQPKEKDAEESPGTTSRSGAVLFLASHDPLYI